jgi:hypothetical protein
MHCWSVGDSIRDADNNLLEEFRARMSRIRLYWYQGYVSDGTDELATLDAKAITLSADDGRVALHGSGGEMHYFSDSATLDRDGFRILREEPLMECLVDDVPPVPTRPRLTPSDTFDYVVVIPSADQGAVCRPREIELTHPDGQSHCLLGSSPRLQISPAGLLPG